jgi:hypothetical protein
MDKLNKTQKDEYATVFALLALYDGGVSTKNIVSWADFFLVGGSSFCCSEPAYYGVTSSKQQHTVLESIFIELFHCLRDDCFVV